MIVRRKRDLMKLKISPSILSADFSNLGQALDVIKENGCDYVHFDVMDGHFVPNISYGVPVLKSLKKHTDTPFDVHLMITHPIDYVKPFADAGADIITFHLESDSDILDTISAIRALDKKVGISVKPNTPIESVYPYISQLDMVLIMTVEPGFGGQGFIYDTLDKIRDLRNEANRQGISLDIEVDGGIDGSTAPLVKEAGANVLVSGSYLFKAPDFAEALATLKD